MSNAAPLDERLNLSGQPGAQTWRWRVNARNCLIAMDAAVDHRPVSALPWDPADEAPGWWERMLEKHFPGAEVSTYVTWQEAGKSISDGGAGTKAVIWLRRKYHGRALTGHLLYADVTDEGVVFIDGQQGTLAKLDDREVDQLVVARFRREPVTEDDLFDPPWETPAEDFDEALEKAESWLQFAYQGEAELVSPDEEDDFGRGWLFACTSRAFLASGEWQDQMLDAAVVVPKDDAAPFGLPNHDPWGWLEAWDQGKRVSQPPPPGEAVWFAPTIAQIGTVIDVRTHAHWAGVLDDVSSLPHGTRVLVWVRRKDHRDRETVGHALWVINEPYGVRVIDPMTEDGFPAIDPEAFELRVIQVA
ncbi:YrhB domain-containing protein [Amycolatopsis sp. NPDC049868]|uniref:YrhB domain-containing protein n=1 Tax=Amycolatopsis sp. NPDC049868 TaxID=3363934 RepID=UPI0037B17715